MEQHKGFVVKEKKDKVYVPKKVLHGLKQVPIAWYNKIDKYLLNLNFKISLSESILYIKGTNTYVIVVSLYVNDLFVTGNNPKMVKPI